MHSQIKYPERLISQAESEAELLSPFLDAEIFSDTQLLASENLNARYEAFQQSSPFLNVFENPELDLSEPEILELEGSLNDIDEELDQNGEFYAEENFVNMQSEEDGFLEVNKLEKPDNYLDDEYDPEEWEEVEELTDEGSVEEIYEIEGPSTELELSRIKSDHESRIDENEIDIEDEKYESDYSDTEDEFDEQIIHEYDLLTDYDDVEEYESGYDEVDLDSEIFHESFFLLPSEDEGIFDEDFEWLSEKTTLVESSIPDSKLSWRGASREQLQFMKDVYKAHVKRSSKKRSFTPSLPKSQLETIEGVELQKDAASALNDLLQAARQEIKSLNKNIKIKSVSGYRSADRQFYLWKIRFIDYYKRTQKDRSKLDGGIHGAKSINLMVRFIRTRFAAPGYSLHQSGIAVDLQPIENGKIYKNSTKSPNRENWRNTWFWKWLSKNAYTYRFFQNNNINEPWHWEYHGNNGTKPKLPERSAVPINKSSWDSIIQMGKDAGASLYQTGKLINIAKKAISKGERNKDKITDDVFFAKYPSRKGNTLKRHDPLSKDWLSIQNNIVLPLLRKLNNAQFKNKTNDDWNANSNISNMPATTQTNNIDTIPEILGVLKVDTSIPKLSKSIPNYKFTKCDALWMARFVTGESGNKNDADGHAVLWAMFNRFGILRHRVKSWSSFEKYLRKYSTTLQPILQSKGAAQRVWKNHKRNRIKYPVVKGNGYYEGTNIRKVQYKKHIDLQHKMWEEIDHDIRDMVVNMLGGNIPNPGIGIATEFASTRIYYRQKHNDNPTEQQWRNYTIDYAKNRCKYKFKGCTWIGDKNNLDQMKNAFFIDNRFIDVPAGAIKILAIP